MDKKEQLAKLLMDLDVEIGSTINSANDRTIVLSNMQNANQIVKKIIDLYEIEF